MLLLELTAAFEFGEEMHLGRYGPDQTDGRQYAGWTIRRNYTVLKTALNWYWREHRIEQKSPAKDAWEAWEKLRKRYNIQLGRGKPWTREEATIVLEEARKLPLLTTRGARWATPIDAMLRLSLGAGLRLGEVTGLQWDRIDFLKRRIRVDTTIDKKGRTGGVKSRARTVSIGDDLVALLLALREHSRSQWVFSTASGQPFGHGQVSRAMTKVRELASARGVSPDRTFHSSRHTFVSLAIQAKQDEWSGCGTKSGTTARPTRGPPIRICWSRPTI